MILRGQSLMNKSDLTVLMERLERSLHGLMETREQLERSLEQALPSTLCLIESLQCEVTSPRTVEYLKPKKHSLN